MSSEIRWEVVCVVMRPALYRVARSVLRDGHEAEDVAQEALLAAWMGIAELRDRDLLAAWMLRLARNAAIDRLRRRTRRTQAILLVEGWSDYGVPEPEDRRALLPEESPELAEALAGIPLAQRRVLELDLQGRSVAEIAAQASISFAAAKTRLSRARGLLRVRMQGGRA